MRSADTPASAAPTAARDDLGATLRRRLLTVPLPFLGASTLGLLAPLLVPVAATVDLARLARGNGSMMSLRLLAFLWVFMVAEAVGLTVAFAQWALTGGGRDRRRLLAWSHALQLDWAASLFAALRLMFRIEVVVEGDAAARPGPLVVFFRHASIVDNLLPAVLLGRRHRLRLRWVLKRELLVDPALDVVGNRLPNYFVDRRSDDAAEEVRRVAALAAGLAADEGVMIFPEGTRFTPARRARVLEKLAARDSPLLERARALRHVMPPRLGGPIALLDADADVLVCAHRGLEGLARVGDIWRGDLVGRRIEVRMWRVPRASIPAGDEARVDWLYETWAEVDRWVGGQTQVS